MDNFLNNTHDSPVKMDRYYYGNKLIAITNNARDNKAIKWHLQRGHKIIRDNTGIITTINKLISVQTI